MKDQKGDKSVEITVLVELFSTFFEKISIQHPDKDILMKNLSKFKNFLYGNQQNLEKGYEFLQTMKEQYNQYLTENQQTQGNNQTIATGQVNTQLGAQLNQQVSQPQQTFQQYQQQHNSQRNQEQHILQKQYVQPSGQTNQTYGGQQQSIKAFKFDLSKLSESANLFKIQSISDFTGVRGEGINPKIALNGSGFSHIREFVSEVNAFYRCIGFRYFEQLLKNQNTTKLQDVLKSVQTKKIQLQTFESDLEENEVREQNRENLRQTFCGYIEYFIENLTSIISRKDRNVPSIVDLQETLYKIVNGDRVFDSALISFIKEQTIRFIQESDPLYIAFLLQNQELKNEKELIQHIRSQDDPLEIAMKIVASGLETQINIHTIENDNSLNEKVFKFNSLPESSKNSLDLLKIKSPYQEGQQLARASSQLYLNQQQQQDPSQQYIDQNAQSLSNNQRNKQQPNTASAKAFTSLNNAHESSRLSQMDDFIAKTGYLKKMLKMFDDNTEDLINKLSNFKDGLNEDEEDKQDEENIEKVLKEQINYSKSRALNFYSNIQMQDRAQAWANEGVDNNN